MSLNSCFSILYILFMKLLRSLYQYISKTNLVVNRLCKHELVVQIVESSPKNQFSRKSLTFSMCMFSYTLNSQQNMFSVGCKLCDYAVKRQFSEWTHCQNKLINRLEANYPHGTSNLLKQSEVIGAFGILPKENKNNEDFKNLILNNPLAGSRAFIIWMGLF